MKGWLRKISNKKMLCDCKTTQTYALVSLIQPIQLHRHTTVWPIPVISSDRISQTGCQPVKIAYYKFACVLPIVVSFYFYFFGLVSLLCYAYSRIHTQFRFNFNVVANARKKQQEVDCRLNGCRCNEIDGNNRSLD